MAALMSSQYEFLDFSDLGEDEYQNLVSIIENLKNTVYEPSEEVSEPKQDGENDADIEFEDHQNKMEDDYLNTSKTETSVAGISFFVDGGTAEDIDPEKIPPMLQTEEASLEVLVIEQEEITCVEEQANFYPSNSVTPQPHYMNQPPPPPNMHNFTNSGSQMFNISPHPNYPPHSTANVPPVPNAMFSHMPPGHPSHMVPPTVYVENCHVNFSPYSTHQQPPGAMYATPPPSYHPGAHQSVYNPYIMTEQSAVPLQVKVPHDKLEYDRNKRHDQHNRGMYRGRVRGPRGGRRRGRDEHERSNSVSSDHSSYSDSGVKSFKESCPPPPANPYNQPIYQYQYPAVHYAINSIPRHGAPIPIMHHPFMHDPYVNQTLMSYPPHQSMSVGPPVSHEHSGHATHPVECEQYNLQQCHMPDHHSVGQQQQIAVTTHSAFMVAANHANQQPNCLYSDSSLEQGNVSYNYAPSGGQNFSHGQTVREFEERQGLNSQQGAYNKPEDIEIVKEKYVPYNKEDTVSLDCESKNEELEVVDMSNGQIEESNLNCDSVSNLLVSPSAALQSEIVFEGQHSNTLQQNEKQPALDKQVSNTAELIQKNSNSDVNHQNDSAGAAKRNLSEIHTNLNSQKNVEMPSSNESTNVLSKGDEKTSKGSCSPGISFLGPTISNGTADYSEEDQPMIVHPNICKENEINTKTNEDSLPVLFETVSVKETVNNIQKSVTSKGQRSSLHKIEFDASCSFADIEESNNIIKSPSGSLTVYKSTSKLKHVDNHSTMKVKGKFENSHNNTTNSSRSSSKESLKDLPLTVVNKHKSEDVHSSSVHESNATLDLSLNVASDASASVPAQEAAWGKKKVWSQLFKGNEDKSGKQIAFVTPFNAQENGQNSIKEHEDSVKDESINYTDIEAEKSKVGELLKNFSPDYRPVQLVPRGLINKNYWCYVNAPLQALLACPSFYQLMQSLTKEAGNKSGNTSTPFINSIVDIAAELTVMPPLAKASRKEKGSTVKKEPDVVTGSPFEPTCVYKMLINCKENQFTEGRQQDAQEMLSCVLNGLHDEMVESLKLAGGSEEPSVNGTADSDKVNYDDFSEDEHEWKVQGPKKKSCITRTAHFTPSPISQIFWGKFRSVVQQAGGSTTANLQPFNSLPLDIQSPKVDSLKDALNQLVAREEISGFTCPKTNQEIPASNQVMLEELPRVLILQLKRFIYDKEEGGLQKVTKRLQFTIDLEITKDLISLNSRGKYTPSQRKYRLFAIVNHEGKEASKGHYVADVYHNGYNCWLRYDDSTVKPIQESFVLRHEPPRVPYLLFYRRNDTFAHPNSNNSSSSSSNNNIKPK